MSLDNLYKLSDSIISIWPNNNLSRGFVKNFPMSLLESSKNEFDLLCFRTNSIKHFIYCLRNKIYKEPKCPVCFKFLNYTNKYLTYCSPKCGSTTSITKPYDLKSNIFFRRGLCRICNEFKVKNKGHNCIDCGNKAQGMAMKKLYKENYKEMIAKCNKKHTEESKRKMSESTKLTILNGTFTPKSNNRLNHKRLKYNNISFRSSWEVKFYMYMSDIGKTISYEKLRIPYKYDNKEHVYIVDFVDYVNKIAYEVKPNSMIDSKTLAKENSLINWCLVNGYKYEFISEDFFNDRQIFEKYKI